MGCSGLTYTYAVYSDFFKEKLQYSQERTDDLGAAKDFGAVAGLFSGLCYFLFPPWVSVFIGALMHSFGYIMILLTLTGRMKASFWLLCFSSAIATGGDNWIDTACIMTTLESFKDHKGTAVGILKSQLGLSAVIFVTVYEAFMETKVVNFLFLITFVPTIVYCGLAFLIKPYTSHEEHMDESDTMQRFKMVSIFVVVLGTFLMGSTSLKEAFELEGIIESFFATVTLLLLGMMFVIPLVHKPLDRARCAFGLMVPIPSALEPGLRCKAIHETVSNEEPGMDEEGTLLETIKEPSMEHSVQSLDKEEDGFSEKVFQDDANIHYPSLKESLLGIDFWLITLVVSSGAGSGLAIINNFAQIGDAVRSNAVDAFVGIISIWSCFGRLVSGYGSDLMVNAGYSRPTCLLITQVAMCLCCLLLSTGYIPCLFLGSAVVGLSYGSYWTLAPTIITEVFGLRQVATLYKLLGLGPTIASYLLSAKVMGYLYDKESLNYRQQLDIKSMEENACYGRRCFEFGLLILASVCFVGVIACSWFTYRTKRIYSRFVHHHLPLSL